MSWLWLAWIAVPFPSMMALAQPKQQTTLHWYGQSAFRIVTPMGKVVLIDPWITNPKNPTAQQDLAALEHVDLILVSHAHFDHVGNAVEIAKRTRAPLVATLDVGRAVAEYLGYPRELATPKTEGNYGGELSLLDGEVKVRFVQALHSSVAAPHQAEGDPYTEAHAAGGAAGFIITIRDGPVVYHTGDTDLFTDMAKLGKAVDVMLICIGDHYTMGPERAAEAVLLVKPRVAVPMHYGTDTELTGTPEQFSSALKRLHSMSRVIVDKVGDTLSF